MPAYWLYAPLQLITGVPAQTIWQPDNNFSARICRDPPFDAATGVYTPLKAIFLRAAGYQSAEDNLFQILTSVHDLK